MNKFIEQKIIELQNSKTATEITQNAKYFINILAENERLTKQLENAVVLPIFAEHDTAIMIEDEDDRKVLEKYEIIGISLDGEDLITNIFDSDCGNMFIRFYKEKLGNTLFLGKNAKFEALARLAELEGKSNEKEKF